MELYLCKFDLSLLKLGHTLLVNLETLLLGRLNQQFVAYLKLRKEFSYSSGEFSKTELCKIVLVFADVFTDQGKEISVLARNWINFE